ncbi:hypothetical protein HF521_010790 [Silurus meridionalis]|uniref:Uncharacterized protein n=1 Tax=Silurus meridionalis TaxID=175797 RepID=A0A8T0AJL8_SILME|nr:hypothetical protein HF521_010790 [Silurus meridionalis]
MGEADKQSAKLLVLFRDEMQQDVCNCYQVGKNVSNLPCGGCKHCQNLHDDWKAFEEDMDDVVPLAVRSIACATEKHVINSAGAGDEN